MTDDRSVLRETDDDARHLARVLLRGARHGALAVLEPDTGAPAASRILVGIDVDGTPVTLVSALAGHTDGLRRDGRASLLVGEPGKGDPLAHPRLTVGCRAERIDRGSPDHVRIRQRFVRRHKKAELYVDFGDFAFFRLVPTGASLNGGFGKAFRLDAGELEIRSPAAADIAAVEEETIRQMNSDRSGDLSACARRFAGAPAASWAMCGLDAAGFDLQAGDSLVRVEFPRTVARVADLRPALLKMYELAH